MALFKTMKTLKHIQVDIDSLKPAKYNPRIELTEEDAEYQKIKRSIKEFGYAAPIIVNKDLTVIGGHQRLNVMKELGYKSIEVAQVNLNKKQEKALNVALNKISGEWDEDKLSDLFEELKEDDYDISLTGFDEDDLIDAFEDVEEEPTENARMNTVKQYNLHIVDRYSLEGFYQMPVIQNDEYIPDHLIGFNYAKTSKDTGATIHFFVDDYQFERLWNTPEQYNEMLRKYECVLSPDFSLYMDMPIAMKIWNIYRSRLLGNYWQRQGMKVIPTISWAEPDTFQFCFDGIPEGSIVAISTIGVKQDSGAMKIWKDGMDEMIKRIHPEVILVYGGKVEYDYPRDTKILYFENAVTERMKEINSKENKNNDQL